MAWARDAGVAHHQWLGYLWDQPRLACTGDCRYDVAVEVTHGRPYGDIGLFRFPPMKVAEVVIRGDLQLEARAFTWLRTVWLPASGYLPADLPAFEAWLGLRTHTGTITSSLRASFRSEPGTDRMDLLWVDEIFIDLTRLQCEGHPL
ncbi:GyrI-like domain-containing protein [Xanthomonas codiaei]|uniref:GyrI-like domain-containing protein n=1 Tax=Xanthomonas codiaei TaxID=56463 RepID=UPI001FC9B07B|nr:GyrI-like domain-containing protein [Xanthomonas codiaei]